MFIKNISGNNLVIGGSFLAAGSLKTIDSLGSRENIRNYAENILQLISDNKVEIQYTDGEVEDRLTIIHSLLMQGFIGVDINKPDSNYYFLKDNFKMKANEYTEKTFLGKLYSLSITPDTNKISMMLITENGLELPADDITKNQTLDFNFEKGITNPILKITSSSTTNVDLFLEGYTEDYDIKQLQRYIRTWKEDSTQWTTTKPICEGLVYNHTMIEKPIVVEDDINGHTLSINAPKEPTVTSEYKIYKFKDNDYCIELIEGTKWNPFDETRFYIRAKNISFIQFSDQTIDLSTHISADISEHNQDKLED